MYFLYLGIFESLGMVRQWVPEWLLLFTLILSLPFPHSSFSVSPCRSLLCTERWRNYAVRWVEACSESACDPQTAATSSDPHSWQRPSLHATQTRTRSHTKQNTRSLWVVTEGAAAFFLIRVDTGLTHTHWLAGRSECVNACESLHTCPLVWP